MFKSSLLIKSMAIIIILSLSYFVVVSFFILPKIENSVYTLEKKNARAVMDKISSVSHHVYKDMNYFKKNALVMHKKNLKNINLIAYSVLETYYAKSISGKMSESQAKDTAYKEISQLTYGEDGYFFILSDNYHILSHRNKNIVGDDYSRVQDINGKFFAREIVDKARINKEAYVTYWLPEFIGKPIEKLSYIKKFEPWNIYLGTGKDLKKISEAIENRKEKLFNALHEIITETKIAQTGYIYVFNSDGVMVHYPDELQENISIRDVKNPNNTTILYQDLIKAYNNSKEMYYFWNKPDDKNNYIYEKVSWIEYVPELDWYIVSATYKSELKQSSIELRNSMIQIALFIFAIFIFIAAIFFRRIDKEAEDKTNEILILNERIETALDANRDAVWEQNVQDWSDSYLSSRFLEMIGYDKNDIQINAFDYWKDKTHPEDYDKVMEEARKNWEGETDYYESTHRVQHKDGHWIWIYSRGNTIFNEDGKATRFIGTFTDITAKKELEDELKIYKKIVDSTKSHMSYIDTDYIYKAVNPIYLIAHQKTKEEIVGHTVAELFTDDIFHKLLKEKLDLCFTGEEVHYSSWFEVAMGKAYMEVSYIPHFNLKDKVIGIIISSNDLTKLHETEEELKKLANVDPLTQLYNRRYLFEMTKEVISLAKRDQTKISMLMIDIDKFKNVNDTYGHAIGDEVIKDLSSLLLKHTRESDIVARIGGEEFVILLPNTSKESAFKFANKLREFVEKEEVRIDEDKSILFTVSIGVSEVDIENEKRIEESLARADKALYTAKESGRNKVS